MKRAGRIAVAFAAAALVLSSTSMAWAGTTPAPPGEANAVAAELKGILAIGKTSAKADKDGGEASGTALSLFDSDLGPQFGGKQTGLGKKNGALIDTGEGAPIRLQVTPWDASVTEENGCRHADSHAALARITLVNTETADVNVLQSESHAQHCTLKSEGQGTSDGATANVLDGAITADLLHSEVATGGKGHTYLVNLLGTELLGDDTTSGACNIEVPGLVKLACLMVGGGAGGVVDATAGDLNVLDETLALVVSGVTATPAAGPGEDTATVPRAATPPAQALPRTGINTFNVMLTGAAMVIAGLLLRRKLHATA